MNTGIILSLVLGGLLAVIPAGILWLLDRSRLMTFGIAIVQMGVQLLLLCGVVWALIKVDKLWLSLLWLLLTTGWLTWLVTKRCKLELGRYALPIGVGLLVSTLLVGLWLLLAVSPAHSLAAQWFVPVTALLSGHSAIRLIQGFSTYIEALKTDEQQYEFLRGNGASHQKALLPFLKRSLQAVFSKTCASLSVMGIATMPLLLVGILLGGIAPLEAFMWVVVLTVGCVAASVLALGIAIWLVDRRLFDSLGKMTLALMAFTLSVTACNGQNAHHSTPTKYELPAPLKDRPEQILTRTGYTTSYNRETKNPNWVAWHLTREHTRGQNQRKQVVFTEDLDVSPRATNNDYYNSRYDRGHMCPAGDNKWDRKAMNESFLFTNICPQNHGLNKNEWNDLEIQCRSWAREYGAIDIVCGPVYEAHNPRTIGKNKVRVPDAFFKVILCRKGSNPKAIGFIYRNVGQKQTLQEAVRTVDEIERLTGIDFFPALEDGLERKIEAEARLSDW